MSFFYGDIFQKDQSIHFLPLRPFRLLNDGGEQFPTTALAADLALFTRALRSEDAPCILRSPASARELGWCDSSLVRRFNPDRLD